MLQQTMIKQTKITRTQWVIVCAAIVLLGLGIWLLVNVVSLFWNFITHSTPSIGAAIIAGSFTLLVSVFSVVGARIMERNKEIAQRRREIEQEIRKQKLPIYEELVAFMFRVVNSQKAGIAISEDEMNKFFLDLTQKTIVWGSDEFVRAFVAFRESSITQTQTGATLSHPIATTLAFERLLYTIRADFGHDNKGLGEGDLLALFVNDIRDVLKKYRDTPQSP